MTERKDPSAENAEVAPESIARVCAFLRGEADLPARRLKENRVRTVWRVDGLPEGPFLVKQYRFVRAADRLRYRLLADKGAREFRNLVRLRAAGVPVPRAFTSGVLRLNEAFFIGSFIEGGVSWPAHADEALVAKLARAVRRLHGERFLHRDLHAGNVLVAGGELYILDFHSGCFLPWLPRRLEVRMLGMLAASLIARGQGHFVPTLTREYAGCEDGRFAAAVMRSALAQRRRHLASRGKRCVIESTAFAIEKRRETVVYRRRELDPAELEVLLSREGRVVGTTARSDVCLFAHGGRRWCRKRTRYSFVRGVLARFAPARLYRAWRGGNALAVHGVAVAKPYAYVRRSACGVLREEILITEELVGYESLTALLGSWSQAMLARDAPSLAESLARFVTRFHETGFWQHDLAPKNVMVRREEDGAWDFRIIDLDGLRRRGLNRRRILRNLVQHGTVPCVSLRWIDRARFLRSYAGGACFDRPTARALKEGILAEMFRRIERRTRSDFSCWP